MSKDYIPEYMTIIDSMPEDPKPVLENPGFDQFRIDVFYYQINNLDKLNEKDRFNFIKSNIDFIANQVIENKCKYIRKLVDPIFLNKLKEVLRTMPITAIRRLFVNKLAYSYQYYANSIPAIQSLLMDISQIVNAPYIDALRGVNLDSETAVYLAMCRFSSEDEMTNVNRLNYAMYIIGSKIMTEQQIVWIYEKLFDQMRYLFSATMLETKEGMIPAKNVDEEDFYETFSTVSLSLLTIVNNMTSPDIERLIRIFLDQWTSYGRPKTRFSLRALSGDFGRVRTIVENFTERNNIYVP